MTKKTAKIKPIAILVCDEIKTEPNTTETFSGALNSGAWLFYGEPREQRLALSFVYYVQDSGALNFELDISGSPLSYGIRMGGPGDDVVAPRENDSENTHEYSSATIGGLSLKIVSDGLIYFKWRENEKNDWKLLRTLRVKYKKDKQWVSMGGLTTAPSSSVHTATSNASTVPKRPS